MPLIVCFKHILFNYTKPNELDKAREITSVSERYLFHVKLHKIKRLNTNKASNQGGEELSKINQQNTGSGKDALV